jgi:tetrahedral aminopeptidase
VKAAAPLPPTFDLELVRALSNATAVSGDEGAVRRLVLEAIRPHVAEVKVDPLGNVLAVVPAAKRNAPRVLLATHMDEVGLMVVDHDSDGGLRFEIVGGVNERILLGKPVLVGPKRLPGIIGAAPMHLLNADRRAAVVKANTLRIDLGATSADAARRLAPVGERATFATEFAVLDGALRGKALDDRLGCALLISLLRGGPYPVELHAAFTVQEEVGLRGAKVAGYAVAPEAAIALDCTPALDLPDSRGRENTQYNARLGAGPVVYLADGRTIGDRRLVDHLTRTAAAANLPYQIRQPGGGATDAAAIQRSGAGVPVVSVSVPARYLHGPAALARTADVENTLRLLHAALAGWTPKVLKP